ncbi:MAG TPA: rhodanese-like domain-containing protein [Chthoniobacteraceae bacterium]|nr:rhodanese-like domain-containing protein [Chthoniobacteraceae bacterium]
MKTTSAKKEASVRTVTPAEVHENREELLLVDVRTPAEFETFHVADSALHPFGELPPGRLRELAAAGRPCVVVCLTGKRALEAARKLEENGLRDLRVLEGGLRAWVDEGLPVERGRKRMSLERQVRIAAGSLIAGGTILALAVHPAWSLLSGLIGAGLVFAGITDTCGMGSLLARMPWNRHTGPTPPACCTPR